MSVPSIDKGPAILREQDGAVAVITINRPWVRNAFTVQMWRDLKRAVEEAAAEPGTRVLVLRGAGEQAFTSGSDLQEFATMAIDDVDKGFQVMEDAISSVENLPIPTVAALNGFALGGGLELALACDIRIGSERATMGMPIARLGIMISPKFAKRLVDVIGPARTKDLLYTGRLVAASEAQAMGLINYFALSHELRRVTMETARRIAGHSHSAVRAAKHAVSLCLPLAAGQGDGLADEPYFIDRQDFPEGVAAFLDRRPPRFTPEEDKA